MIGESGVLASYKRLASEHESSRESETVPAKQSSNPKARNRSVPVDPSGNPKARNQLESVNEVGGPKGLEPTRYGDWEVNGRCSDF